MFKRLNITLFGTLYHVAVLHLTPDVMRVGTRVYGKEAWDRMLRNVALGSDSKKLAREVEHTLGQPLKRVFQCSGVAMDGHSFGLEAFYRGDYHEVNTISAQNAVVDPGKLMIGFDSEDSLAVYWDVEEGAYLYRWDGVDQIEEEEVTLVYDDLSTLLGVKNNFNLTRNVIWKGKEGSRREVDFGTGLRAGGQVYHRGK